MQESASMWTTTRAFVFLVNLLNVIITKYSKEEVDDDFSVCVNERSSCGLSMTGDVKIFQCHVIKMYWLFYPNGEVPYELLSRICFSCSNLITVTPLWLELKRFVKVTWLWGDDVTNSWSRVYNFSIDINFQTGHFAKYGQFKSDGHFADYGQVLTPHLFLLPLGRSVILLNLGGVLGRKKPSKTPFLWRKIQEPRIWSSISHFQ